MQKKHLQEAEKYAKQNQRRRNWRKIVRVMACVVVFCTTYALILPAITLEKNQCGLEPHTHRETCYEKVLTDTVTSLSCTYETLGVHVHGPECADEAGNLLCGMADFVIHAHDASCLDAEGALVCQLPEVLEHTHCDACYAAAEAPHEHTDACYTTQQGELTCQKAETEGHTHGEDCFTQGELLCEVPESEEHTHDAGCYEAVLVCQIPEEEAHIHGDGCYEQLSVLNCKAETVPAETEAPELICGKEELHVHTHGDACYETYTDENGEEQKHLICTETVLVAHSHGESCFVTEEVPAADVDILTCTLAENHVHAEGCYDESGTLTCTEAENHTHGEMCYGTWVLICGKEEHTHSEACTNLTAEELLQVEAVIALIDAMPSSEQIDERMMELENAGDLTGLDVYFAEVSAQVCEIHEQYELLTDDQKAYVTNADKLLALEYMWANQEEASAYVAKISGYNMNANNVFEVDGYLGVDAGYAADGVNKGKWASHTKQVMANCNVIFVNLPKPDGVHRANIGTFFLGSNWTKLIEKRTKQGHFSVNLYDDWCAIRVEPSTTYPFYVAEQIIVNDDEVQRIGRITHVSDSGYVVLVRKSYIKSKGLYMPEKSAGKFAMVHMNKEILWTKIGRRDFIEDPGWLPRNTADASTLGPFAYMTLSPIVTNYADKALAGERSDDRDVVSNIKFKLFDYSKYINKTKQSDNDDSYRALASYYYFRGGIAKDANRDYALDVANYTPNVNADQPLDGKGHALYDQDGYTLYHARVEPNLWNGYPILDFTVDAKGNPMDPPSGWGTGKMLNPRSLRFLFDQDYAYGCEWTARHKIATGAVTEYHPKNTILQFNEDTHTYWYDSSKNAVDYDIDAQLFRVRAYTERTSITADWPLGDVPDDTGDFLPFNYCDGIVNATYHPGTQLAQGGIMDSSYPMNDVNYWFGMSMEFSFLQGKDGTVTYTDSNGVKHTDVMEFKFSGDDDVWVFIDGVRILDLGGTHGSVDGSINFQTGEVFQKMTWEENPNKSYPTTLEKCFTLAGKTPKGGWDDNGERFADYSVHTLKFFYLERGTAVANCSIEFNLPNFDTPLVVGKTLNPANESVDPEVLEYLRGNTEYSYRVLETDANGTVKKDANGNPVLFMKEGQKYTLVDHNQLARSGTEMTVGENGIFKLKHGQQAVFEDLLGIAGYADKYFVIEEILPNNQTGHYNKIQYTIDADVGTMMGEADDTLEDFIGYYSPAISAGEPQQVQYTNVVDTETLSVLKITKAVTEASEFAEDQEFTVNVKLDGEYLAADTKYSIDGTEYTVGKNGAVTLKAGQTAEILVPVLAGTTFEVVEAAEDTWVVTYQSVTTDKDGIETTASGNSGSFPMDGTVHVTITNSTYQYRVPLTFTKEAIGNDSSTREFTFEITQVDQDGNALTTPTAGISWPQNPTITPSKNKVTTEEVVFTFGASVENGTYYFKLVEQDMDGWLEDPSVYIIAIQISDGTGKISSITKNGKDYGTTNRPAFVNYAERTVTIDKTVTGNYTEAELQKPFSFTAVVTLDGKQVVPEAGDGYTVASDGTVTFTLTHDQAVTINGIPYGATVTVTESGAPGYSTHYTLNDFAQKHSSSSAEVSGVISNNTIHFVNKGGYKLPETGGAGTTIYAMAGLVLICFSMAYLMYRPKARRREEF